jgi:hypothetical protein
MLISFTAYALEIASLKKTRESVKFFLGLYGLVLLSGWFSDAFLFWAGKNFIYIGINFLFIWVPLNKNEHARIIIESLLKTISESIHNNIDFVKSKIPKYVEK